MMNENNNVTYAHTYYGEDELNEKEIEIFDKAFEPYIYIRKPRLKRNYETIIRWKENNGD